MKDVNSIQFIWQKCCGAQASILHYAKGITEAAAEGAQVKDCVITVPAFFGPPQRQAVVDAASLAGPLIASHDVILNFGIQDFYVTLICV